jgi:hypothetical protein
MEWGFQHPGLWPLLALTAVPLLVHLISKRRAREVRFAAMEFVLRSQRRSARRIQLRQWLLLLARTVVVAAAVLAILGPLQRPTVTAGGGAGLKHVLAVDVTASMMAAPDGNPRWTRAVPPARAALKALPPEEPAAILACGTTPQALLEPPSFDRAAAEEALGRITGTLGAGDLVACLARARLALGTQDGAARVTLFSDAARHSWPATARADVGGLRVAVVRPDDLAPVNHALGRVSVKAAPEAGARAVAVEFDVEVFGPAAEGAEVPVTLVVDGVEAARTVVVPKGSGPTQKRFTHVLPREGGPAVHNLSVVLAPDALTVDDALTLPVKTPREVNVLVVDGDPQTVAWRDEIFYLERALSAPPKTGGALQVRVLSQAPAVQDVDDADVVMLCNVRTLPREVVGALERHVKRGGGLFISGGDRVDVDFYNGALGQLLPQPLRGEKSRVELDDPKAREVLGIGQLEVGHPIFAPFNGVRPEGLTRAQTHTLLLLEPGSRAQRTVLMRFSNEAPALVERQVGQGRVLLWTTSVDRDWSDLAIRPGFLPLVQQMVLYLADALEDTRPRFTRLGTVRTVPLPRGVGRVAVVGPQGVVLPVVVQPQDTQVPLPLATDLGVHQVLMAGVEGELAEVPAERFAAWPAADEADLAPLSDEELTGRLPPGSELLGRGGADGGQPVPWWPWLLALLQLAWVAEGLLARRG